LLGDFRWRGSCAATVDVSIGRWRGEEGRCGGWVCEDSTTQCRALRGDRRGVDWGAWTVGREGKLFAWTYGDMRVCNGGDWYGRRLGGSYGWWHNYKTDGGVGSAIELAAVGGRKQVIFSDSPLIYSQ
jgi:hypothetical protein